MKLALELATGNEIIFEPEFKTMQDFYDFLQGGLRNEMIIFKTIDIHNVEHIIFINQIVQISEVKPVGNISFQIDGVELAKYELSQDSFNKQLEHNRKILKGYYGAIKTREEMKKEAADLFNEVIES